MKVKYTFTAVLSGWLVLVIAILAGTSTQPAQAQTSGISMEVYYKLLARRSGKVLDVNGSSTADGGYVQQWADNGQTNRQWRPGLVSSGVYKLLARHNGRSGNNSTRTWVPVETWAILHPILTELPDHQAQLPHSNSCSDHCQSAGWGYDTKLGKFCCGQPGLAHPQGLQTAPCKAVNGL